MGGSCLHKTDKDGCPVYIERLVRQWRKFYVAMNRNLQFFCRATTLPKKSQSTLQLTKLLNIILGATNFCIELSTDIVPRKLVKLSIERPLSSTVQAWDGTVRDLFPYVIRFIRGLHILSFVDHKNSICQHFNI
jgi:hypothetical protein